MANHQEDFIRIGSINKINWPGHDYTFGIGKVIENNSRIKNHENNEMVLLFDEDNLTEEMIIKQKERCIPLPGIIDSKESSLLIPLVFALWAWERLNLEIGEIALVTEGNPFSGIFVQVAVWHGALPVFQLGNELKYFDGIENIEINWDEPLTTIELLRNRIKSKAGFAGIDLSGKPEVIDILLEILPRWGKLMLLGQTEHHLTIDYYNNLHRIGVYLTSCELNPIIIFKKQMDLSSYIDRACKIIQNKSMVKSLLDQLPALKG